MIEVDEVVRLAASLEQVSPHVLATAIVTDAAGRGLALQMPEAVQETAGYGLSGRVPGVRSRSASSTGSSTSPTRRGCAGCADGRRWTAR